MKTGSIDTVGVLRSLLTAALLLSERPRPELYFSWSAQPHCVVAFARRNLKLQSGDGPRLWVHAESESRFRAYPGRRCGLTSQDCLHGRGMPFLIFAFQPSSKAWLLGRPLLMAEPLFWRHGVAVGARLSSVSCSGSRCMSFSTAEGRLGSGCSLSLCKTLGLIPTLNTPSLVCACILTTQEV